MTPNRIVPALVLAVAALTSRATPGQVRSTPPSRVAVHELPVERALNVFFARVVLNGKGPFWFTVDTGATLTVIDPSTASRLGLQVADEGEHRNLGVASGLTELKTARGLSIAVGGAPPFVPDKLFVVPVRGNAGALGHAVDGVLGTDFLRRYVVEFDYPAGRVRLHGAAGFAYRGNGTIVPVELSANLLLAPAAVALNDDTTMTAHMLVDTGSSARLTFNAPFVRRHNLTRFPPLGLTASVGINGVTSAPVIGLRYLAFGQATLDRPEVALSHAASGLTSSDAFDGIIGAELLSRFRLFVDYPARRLILEAARVTQGTVPRPGS